jgi:translation elongation factor EF-Tu-like GTPase
MARSVAAQRIWDAMMAGQIQHWLQGFEPLIEAEITFLRSEEGGRTGPAYAGYRPAIYYDDDEGGWDAVYDWETDDPILPGATLRARVCFVSPEAHRGRLYIGKEFRLQEGSHVVALGRVTKLFGLESEDR